jgi:mycothiol synthase
MVTTRVIRRLSPAERQLVTALIEESAATGGSLLDDHLLVDLAHGSHDGFVAVLASSGEDLVGYAQASAGHDGYVVGAVTFSAAADVPASDNTRMAMMTDLLAQLPSDSAVTWWPDPADRDAAGSLGFHPSRVLLRMHIPLPVDASADLPTRPFRVGSDEEAWLEVNNAAFHWHGEQGGWDLATLLQRENEEWFDAAGFLLHERDSRLAGFCWTKLHQPDPLVVDIDGEIYVIAVHPDFHGMGLGKSLTIAGLQYLHSIGASRGMLYVDATNHAAVRLYEKLGFQTTLARHAYRRSPEGDPS